jgi:hypothetical protein
MSKTKRSGDRARIAALEKDLRRLRAQLPREIHHAVRHELAVELERRESRSLTTVGRQELGLTGARESWARPAHVIRPVTTRVAPYLPANLGHVPTAEELSHSEAEA